MSPIAGFDSYQQVLAVLAALDHEVPKNESHAEAIAKQVEVFSAEAERYEAEEAARVEAEYAERVGFIQRRKLRKKP
jgi:hypothetical protein